jgi:hypothetical protein
MTSGLPPGADIVSAGRHVSNVRQTDSCTAAKLFDRLVGAGKKQSWKLYPECLRGLEVQNEIELIGLLNGRHAMNTTTAPSEFMSAGSGAFLATGCGRSLVADRQTPPHSALALG